MATQLPAASPSALRPAWRRHLVAAGCSLGYLGFAITAGLVRAHYGDVCWGKGPGSGLADLVGAAFAIVGLALLAGCWLASALLDTGSRSRAAITTATGVAAVLSGLAAAAAARPPYC